MHTQSHKHQQNTHTIHTHAKQARLHTHSLVRRINTNMHMYTLTLTHKNTYTQKFKNTHTHTPKQSHVKNEYGLRRKEGKVETTFFKDQINGAYRKCHFANSVLVETDFIDKCSYNS
jgi:hypothetical protein